MPRHALALPSCEPHGWRDDIGPGPLSPAWVQPKARALPEDELLALAEELSALRRECVRSLDPRAASGPLLLSRAEREKLNAALARLQGLNAGLPHHRRSAVAARWKIPALPEGTLFGARDLRPLLDTAIAVAHQVVEARRWPMRG